jgi:predicted DNA-binding transcriptional regulator YafY
MPPVFVMSADLSFDYINHRGEKSRRTVTPIAYRFGVSTWHSGAQWLMMALDHDKSEPREFAMRDMSNITAHPFPVLRAGAQWQSPLRDLITRIDMVAQNHMAYSQAAAAISNLRDHLGAMAFCEEVNRRDVPRAAGHADALPTG